MYAYTKFQLQVFFQKFFEEKLKGSISSFVRSILSCKIFLFLKRV